MNTTPTAQTTTSTTSFAAWLGLDWGDKEHAFCLLALGEAQPQTGKLSHSAENLHRWFKELEERFVGRPVALAVESNRGALLHVLAQYPWLEIFPINPVTSARYRQAFIPSGAKDDVPDAKILLDLVHGHADRLRPLVWEDQNTRKLAGLVQARRDTVDRRTQALNQLTSVLKGYYPQALALVGEDLAAPLALEFLKRWPDLLSLKSARPATLRSFYYRHNVRRPELVDQRLQSLTGMVALTTDDAVVSVAARLPFTPTSDPISQPRPVFSTMQPRKNVAIPSRRGYTSARKARSSGWKRRCSTRSMACWSPHPVRSPPERRFSTSGSCSSSSSRP